MSERNLGQETEFAEQFCSAEVSVGESRVQIPPGSAMTLIRTLSNRRVRLKTREPFRPRPISDLAMCSPMRLENTPRSKSCHNLLCFPNDSCALFSVLRLHHNSADVEERRRIVILMPEFVPCIRTGLEGIASLP